MALSANVSALLASLFLLNYYFVLTRQKNLFELILGPNNANEQRNLGLAFDDESELYENIS